MQNSELVWKSYFNALIKSWNCLCVFQEIVPMVSLFCCLYDTALIGVFEISSELKLVNFETFNYKNISKGWRLISTYCSIISKQSPSDQLDNQLSRRFLWLLGYGSFFSSDLLYKVGPSSKGSTPLTFGIQRFLRPWLIFKKISTPFRYFYNFHLM